MTKRQAVEGDAGVGGNLFGGEAPLFRRKDPPSSKEAAGRVVASGRRDAQLVAVMDGVREYPGSTSKELSAYCEMDRYIVARRLPDLEHRGLVVKGRVRKCRISGTRAVAWWPYPEHEED